MNTAERAYNVKENLIFTGTESWHRDEIFRSIVESDQCCNYFTVLEFKQFLDSFSNLQMFCSHIALQYDNYPIDSIEDFERLYLKCPPKKGRQLLNEFREKRLTINEDLYDRFDDIYRSFEIFINYIYRPKLVINCDIRNGKQ